MSFNFTRPRFRNSTVPLTVNDPLRVTSPDGTVWELEVDNDGDLSATEVE